MHNTARADTWTETLQPFAWLFALSFAAGFWGYTALEPLLAR
jgi:hypothetical protein